MAGPSLESGDRAGWWREQKPAFSASASAIVGNMIFKCSSSSLQARTYRKNNAQTQSNSEGLEVSNYSLCPICNHYSVSTTKHIKQYTGRTMVYRKGNSDNLEHFHTADNIPRGVKKRTFDSQNTVRHAWEEKQVRIVRDPG